MSATCCSCKPKRRETQTLALKRVKTKDKTNQRTRMQSRKTLLSNKLVGSLVHFELYNLYTLHSTLETLHFTSCSACHSTLYTLHFTLQTLYLTLGTLHFTFHTLELTPHTLHFALYIQPFTLNTLCFTLCVLHSILYALHFTLYTLHSTLFTLPSTLCTLHCTLTPHTPHYTLNILQFTLTFDTPLYTLHSSFSIMFATHVCMCFCKHSVFCPTLGLSCRSAPVRLGKHIANKIQLEENFSGSMLPGGAGKMHSIEGQIKARWSLVSSKMKGKSALQSHQYHVPVESAGGAGLTQMIDDIGHVVTHTKHRKFM